MMPSNHAIVSNHRYCARSKPILLPQLTSIILHQPHIHTPLLQYEHITINSSALIFDPAATFAGPRIEIRDTLTKEAISFNAVPESSAVKKQEAQL